MIETHEASIQIILDAFTTENKPNNTITHPSTGVDIGTKVLSDNLMQQLKEVGVEFCTVASGIQNSQVYFEGVLISGGCCLLKGTACGMDVIEFALVHGF